jgi:peroxiredoxin
VKKPVKWPQVISYSLNIVLTIETLLLLRQIGSLEERLQSETAPKLNLIRGDIVQGFAFRTADGSLGTLTYEDPSISYLFFIFTTSCPYCLKTITVWNQIAENLESSGCTVIGISLHDLELTRRYTKANDLRFYTVVNEDTSFQSKYEVSGVPMTVLVRGDGVVEGVWRGELSHDSANEVSRQAVRLLASSN